MKKTLAVLLVAVLVLALAACGGNGAPAPPPEPEPEGIFTPGTFTGVGTGGYGGDITVELTFDAEHILGVEVLEHGETDLFADMAFAVLLPGVLEAQGAELDVVSGATYTSGAFLEAVANAIDAASN